MFFNEYPYRNITDLNLDFLLKSIRELTQIVDTFVHNEEIKFANPIKWSITSQYAKNTVVINTNGDAYLSTQPVPAGIQLNNEDYWSEIFNFTNYTRTANKNLTVNVESDTTRATTSYAVDDWLIWDDVLYKVTNAIAVDDAFLIDTNIVHFTVEDFIKAFITYATGLINQYKNDIDASELAYRQQLALDIATTTNQLQSQLDQAISGATVDSEVLNARVDLNGYIWDTLGNAIRGQISRVLSVIDRENAMANNEQFSYTWLQGYHGTNGGTFVSDSNQIETDFFVVPTGTTIEVKTSRSSSQVAVKEWQRTSTAYQRIRIVQGVAGAPVTVSDTNSNYLYTVSVFNSNGIDTADPRATANVYNGIKSLNDIIATAPYYRDGITDLNLMTDAGFYNINSTGYTNVPTDFNSNGVLFVIKGSTTSRLLQILGSYGTNSIWFRNAGSDNGFSAWRSLGDEIYINASNLNNINIKFGSGTTKLIHTENAGLHQDNYNISTIGKNANIICPSGSDLIGPVQIDNVFVGGVHGYELTNFVCFIVDGVKYDHSNLPTTSAKKLQIFLRSILYSPTDGTTPIANRFITITFENNKMSVDSNIEFITNVNMQRACLGGMIAARNDILQWVLLNNMYIQAPTTAVSGTVRKCNNKCSFITSVGTITLTVNKGYTEDNYRGVLLTYANETPIRNKFYGDIYTTGNYQLHSGDSVNGAFTIEIN